jgi:hypothetical protein
LSARTKARVLSVALALLTLWPAVHIFLAVRHGLSPWKLAGWGMYASPRFGPLGLEISGRIDDEAPWVKLASPSPALREDARIFVARYRWLGGLTRPDALARTALREHPDWRELRVTTYRPVLDKSSGMVVLKQTPYDYPRAR